MKNEWFYHFLCFQCLIDWQVVLTPTIVYPWRCSSQLIEKHLILPDNGRINIKLYPGTSLVGGDQTREFSAIRQGVIDMAVGSTINWSPQVKELNLFSLPFLMPDYKAIDALTQGEVGKQMFTTLEKAAVWPKRSLNCLK